MPDLTRRDTTIDGTWVRVALTGCSTGQLVLARSTDEALARRGGRLASD